MTKVTGLPVVDQTKHFECYVIYITTPVGVCSNLRLCVGSVNSSDG